MDSGTISMIVVFSLIGSCYICCTLLRCN